MSGLNPYKPPQSASAAGSHSRSFATVQLGSLWLVAMIGTSAVGIAIWYHALHDWDLYVRWNGNEWIKDEVSWVRQWGKSLVVGGLFSAAIWGVVIGGWITVKKVAALSTRQNASEKDAFPV